MIPQLLLQLILILVNALFAATEIALISLNENKMRAQAESGDKKARKLLKIIEEPTKFLSTIQVGITLAGFLGSAFAADNFSNRLTDMVVAHFQIAPSHTEFIDTISVILITIVLSYFTLVFGELVPKRLAMKHKERLAGSVCGFISMLTKLLKPLIWFLTASTNLVLRLFGVNPHEKDETVSEEDIVIMLNASADEGTLKQDEVAYIKNVFKLDRLSAADIMTQRSAVVSVPCTVSEEELLKIIDVEGYSRIPVYAESIDKIVGILHSRTYLLKRSEPHFKLEDALLSPEFVPETIHLDSLFKDMQSTHTHMVIVVNEYGLTSGILTMEDILEEIVGEIWDEQDEAIELFTSIGRNTYRVSSSVSIDEFFEFFGLSQNEDISSTTVNGWLTEACGNIPEIGYTFDYEHLSLEVIEADDLMTCKIIVTVKSNEKERTPEDCLEE